MCLLISDVRHNSKLITVTSWSEKVPESCLLSISYSVCGHVCVCVCGGGGGGGETFKDNNKAKRTGRTWRRTWGLLPHTPPPNSYLRVWMTAPPPPTPRPTPLISRSGSPEVSISEVVLGKISAQPNTFLLWCRHVSALNCIITCYLCEIVHMGCHAK